MDNREKHFILFSVIAGGMLGVFLDFLSRPWNEVYDIFRTNIITDFNNNTLYNAVSGKVILYCMKFPLNNGFYGALANLAIYSFATISMILLICIFMFYNNNIVDELEIKWEHLLFTILFSTVPFFISIRIFSASMLSVCGESPIGDVILFFIYIATIFSSYYWLIRNETRKLLILLLLIIIAFVILNFISDFAILRNFLIIV